MSTWRYKLTEEFVVVSRHLLGVHFKNDWMMIDDGIMRIQPKYAWDGCTPSFNVPFPGLPNGLWFGIWDGPLGEDCRPITWRATLCHDALCQFRAQIVGLSKKKTILFFEEQLVMNKSPLWMDVLYPAAVARFGPQEWQ